MYSGKDTELGGDLSLGHAARVVYTLATPILKQGYCIYVDNFYTSPQLALLLTENQTDVVGTLRKNRKGLPSNLKSKLNKDERDVRYEENGTMMVMKWKDKRDVFFLSTIHKGEETVNASRRGKDVTIPKVTDDYNKNMGGVDKCDQMLTAYPVERRRVKVWYKKVFRHLLNMCIFNAHVLHAKLGGNMNSFQFREALVEGLLLKYHTGLLTTSKRGRKSKEENPLRLKERHFPSHIPASEKKEKPTRSCSVCAAQKQRKESRYQCGECDVALCVDPCFRIYHTQKSF